MAEVDIALEYCLGLVLGSVQECRHDTVVQTRTYGRSRLFDAPLLSWMKTQRPKTVQTGLLTNSSSLLTNIKLLSIRGSFENIVEYCATARRTK